MSGSSEHEQADGDESTITESHMKLPLCPSVTERYFTVGYKVNLPQAGLLQKFKTSKSNFSDVRILRHSNRICLITLAPTHPVIYEKKKISNISFKVTEKLDRSDNCVSGKRKRGAQWLNPSSPLCLIYCEDGSKYTIYCGIRASLIEMNDKLLSHPDLLQRKFKTEGYIAVVMPKLAEAGVVMDALLSEKELEQYRAYQADLPDPGDEA